MVEAVKHFLRNTPVLSQIYYMAKVLRDMPMRDWYRLGKLNVFRRTYPNTMVGYARLSNAYELAQIVERENLEGAFVECGVWKGGCIATMAWVAERRAHSNRAIWLFDSFEGLPEPTDEDGPKGWKHVSDYAAPQEAAQELFSRLNINPDNVHIVKGWFRDTLPVRRDEIGPISILRLDGDLYDSTKCCLEYLYAQVVPGGYVIIDDYGCWEGCKIATDEFLQNVDVELQAIDKKGRFFQKPY